MGGAVSSWDSRRVRPAAHAGTPPTASPRQVRVKGGVSPGSPGSEGPGTRRCCGLTAGGQRVVSGWSSAPAAGDAFSLPGPERAQAKGLCTCVSFANPCELLRVIPAPPAAGKPASRPTNSPARQRAPRPSRSRLTNEETEARRGHAPDPGSTARTSAGSGPRAFTREFK